MKCEAVERSFRYRIELKSRRSGEFCDVTCKRDSKSILRGSFFRSLKAQSEKCTWKHFQSPCRNILLLFFAGNPPKIFLLSENWSVNPLQLQKRRSHHEANPRFFTALKSRETTRPRTQVVIHYITRKRANKMLKRFSPSFTTKFTKSPLQLANLFLRLCISKLFYTKKKTFSLHFVLCSSLKFCVFLWA